MPPRLQNYLWAIGSDLWNVRTTVIARTEGEALQKAVAYWSEKAQRPSKPDDFKATRLTRVGGPP